MEVPITTEFMEMNIKILESNAQAWNRFRSYYYFEISSDVEKVRT